MRVGGDQEKGVEADPTFPAWVTWIGMWWHLLSWGQLLQEERQRLGSDEYWVVSACGSGERFGRWVRVGLSESGICPGQIWERPGQIVGHSRDGMGRSWCHTCLGMDSLITVIFKLWYEQEIVGSLGKILRTGLFPHHPGRSPQVILFQVIYPWHFKIA